MDEQRPLDVDRLRRQEPEAFRALVEEQRRLVMGLGQSMGLHGADLDDAAADAFAAIYRALPGFQGQSQVGTWVYRIAARAFSRARQKRRDMAPLPEEWADATGVAPGHALEQDERNGRLWAAVARLEARQAAAVELHYRQEWPVERIAEAMGCPTGTVKTLLFRARARLREMLEQEGVEL